MIGAAENVLDVGPVAGAVVLAIAVVAGVGVLRVWLATRPRKVEPGPETMELREESPALVDLLTGGFEVDDDAVPATAVDLATRGFYDIEDTGGGNIVLRLRGARRPHADDLMAYESRVLRLVEGKAQGGVTPAAVLTIGAEGVSERWFKGFVREVTKHGRALGLCRRRFDLQHLAQAWGLVIVGAAPAWLLVGFGPRTDDPTGWVSLGNLFAGIALLAGIALVVLTARLSRSDAQGDTAAGREAAAEWLGVREFYRDAGRFEAQPAPAVAIWERHLAYATAMGLAPEVQRQLPFETEHDRHAWSRATGRWRRVKVRYQSFRPGWGFKPWALAFGGLVQAIVAGALAYFAFAVAGSDELDTFSDEQRRWIGLVALVVAALFSVVVVFAIVKVILGVADLVPRRTVEGEVVRRRVFRQGHRLPRIVQWGLWSGTDEHGMRRSHDRKTRHHLAIDDGADDRILAYLVERKFYDAALQGSRVRVRVSPLLGYVAELEVLAGPRPSAASEPTLMHPLAEDTIQRAGSAATGRLQEAIAAAESMTDESGRPLLDQTDDDGVALRDRLAESREQLDRLREDPRFTNSPIAGIFDALGDALDPPDGRDDTA